MKIKIFLLTFFLIVTLRSYGQTSPEPASKIIEKAYKQAAAEKKNVMVIFQASYCGWCRKFEASMEDPACKDYFDRSFVRCELTIMETGEKKNLDNPGAMDIYNQNGGTGGGIPYFLIYNSKGDLLADSRIRPAGAGTDAKLSNMGCPAGDEEVAAFVELLKKTSKITDNEIAAVTGRFKKNRN